MLQIKSVLVVFFLSIAWIFPAASQAASMPNGADASYKWKFATLAPRGVGWARQVEEVLFPVILEECEGDLFVKVYWGGVLGEDADVVAMIKNGRLSGGGFAGQGATLLCKEFGLFELPFLFNDYGEVDFIKEKMQPVLDEAAARNGLKLFLWNDQDFDQIYSTRHPIASLEDTKKASFIAWYGPMEETLLHRLGAKTVKVEVSRAASVLRQGEADAGIAPAIWVAGTQLYSILRYVNPIKIRYSPAPIAASLEAWNTLPEEYQTALLSRQMELQDKFCQGVREDNEKSIKAMLQYGLKEVRVNPRNLESMRRQALPVWKEMTGVMYSQELLDEVQAHLEAYRTPTP
ncbi:Putative TRAP-type C4-dicarboxylate transport system, DctP subunit [Desulfatibacillum aliphaticivorans]|uniref:TRAP-type C4-dicarboxylate transport system, DctP subunit n=1 Tax=Desulfatibacillum aliphaticivorans TaxID=218208 RepID=B8FCV8_DESAL|nr:TRAP transporter substrate-binding protein DctP [Desulfatibacillum aliphaticivorans]ACL06389.1 Putative TRAP-type C4-dicarboxylate transport system, DctP subunit [Desulfatibacillum aliphaticivorans]